MCSLQGDGGVMDEIKLSNAADNFTRGKTDKFTFRGPDVGANKRFTFRLVGGIYPNALAMVTQTGQHLSFSFRPAVCSVLLVVAAFCCW
jgi:hypothetical protein